MPYPQATLNRFWEKVDQTSECWEWTASTHGGYGYFRVASDTVVLAHRFAYEQAIGAIPDHLELDHLCRNKACVNPEHLEAVTHRANVLRGEGLAAKNAVATHCKYGHPLTDDNVYRYGRKRRCKRCASAWSIEQNRRARQLRKVA